MASCFHRYRGQDTALCLVLLRICLCLFPFGSQVSGTMVLGSCHPLTMMVLGQLKTGAIVFGVKALPLPCVLPPPVRLSCCLHLVFPPPSWLKRCLCLVSHPEGRDAVRPVNWVARRGRLAAGERSSGRKPFMSAAVFTAVFRTPLRWSTAASFSTNSGLLWQKACMALVYSCSFTWSFMCSFICSFICSSPMSHIQTPLVSARADSLHRIKALQYTVQYF